MRLSESPYETASRLLLGDQLSGLQPDETAGV